MAAILFVIVLNAQAGQVGASRAVSRYPGVPDEKHLAFGLCEAHARILTQNSDNLAYYCKEIDDRE